MSSTRPRLNVLFVCTGNTCRSPLAVLALREELGEDAALVAISSAGTGAASGMPRGLTWVSCEPNGDMLYHGDEVCLVPFTVSFEPLPVRRDGHFMMDAQVLSFVSWTYPGGSRTSPATAQRPAADL